MIKLPDFTKCVQIQHLMQAMGIVEIPQLPEIEFERTRIRTKIVQVPNAEQLEFAEKIKFTTIPINRGDIQFDSDGLIEINEQKSCIYIKKQDSSYYNLVLKTSTYRFHLCNCGTIEAMTTNGRRDRYVATSRDDEKFEVNIQGHYGKSRIELLTLELCQNCIAHLKNRQKYFNPFSLKEFYRRYQPEIPPYIQRVEQVPVTEKYAPNHQDVAHKYKKILKYKCQKCEVDCSEQPNLLHMHHINGNGTDNKRANLNFICVACHMEQPYHGHMKNDESFLGGANIIRRLRKEQGLYSIG